MATTLPDDTTPHHTDDTTEQQLQTAFRIVVWVVCRDCDDQRLLRVLNSVDRGSRACVRQARRFVSVSLARIRQGNLAHVMTCLAALLRIRERNSNCVSLNITFRQDQFQQVHAFLSRHRDALSQLHTLRLRRILACIGPRRCLPCRCLPLNLRSLEMDTVGLDDIPGPPQRVLERLTQLRATRTSLSMHRLADLMPNVVALHLTGTVIPLDGGLTRSS
jgi:hypothetical protein